MRDTRHPKQAGSRRQRSEEEAEIILGRYFESGLTQRVFAERNGVCVSTLQYWLRRAESRLEEDRGGAGGLEGAGGFSLLEVELAAEPRRGASGAPIYEIELAAGGRLRVPGGYEREEVRGLLALLKEVN